MGKLIGMDGKSSKNEQKTEVGNQEPLDLTKAKNIVCKKCGFDVYVKGMMFKKASAILTGQPHDTIVPAEVYLCANCGETQEDLMPDAFKKILKG